jgi:hypothetical protein
MSYCHCSTLTFFETGATGYSFLCNKCKQNHKMCGQEHDGFICGLIKDHDEFHVGLAGHVWNIKGHRNGQR